MLGKSFWKQSRLVISTGVLLLTVSSAYAQPSPLTLNTALELAIKNNPHLHAERAKLGLSNAQIKTAGARLNPTLMSDNGIAESTYRAGIEQIVELGGKRRKRIDVAQANRDVTNSDIQVTLLTLRYDVRKAYTDLYTAKAHLMLLQDISNIAQELVTIAKKREHAGDISTLEVLQADIIQVNADSEQQLAIAKIAEANTQLNTVLNQPLESSWDLAPPATSPETSPDPPTANTPIEKTLRAKVEDIHLDLDRLLEQALRLRPEITKNALQLKAADLQKKVAQSNRIPNVKIAAGPDYVSGADRQFNAFIIGNVEIPLLNRQQGPIAEADAKKVQLEREKVALQAIIRKEVTQAYIRFAMNQERIKRYETTILPLAHRVKEKSHRAFVEGQTSILTPINAQQAYMNTRLGYLNALTEFQNAISDLEKAVGSGL